VHFPANGFYCGHDIWILALVLMGACVALGHKLGAIRAAITFIGFSFRAACRAIVRPHQTVAGRIWAFIIRFGFGSAPFIVFIICSAFSRRRDNSRIAKCSCITNITQRTANGLVERINSRVGFASAR